MKIIRDEKKDPLTGRCYTTISYLVEPHETEEEVAETVKQIHPNCDLEVTYSKEHKKFGYKIRTANGKDVKFV